jgi:hypothetical protein
MASREINNQWSFLRIWLSPGLKERMPGEDAIPSLIVNRDRSLLSGSDRVMPRRVLALLGDAL